jgi:DNA-binding NarL/FixJ family response regulator
MALQVLVAEDSAPVRQSICALLEAAHLTVVGQAADGAEAVRLADLLRPDVVIIDDSMPVLNGVEAARAMRRARPDLAVILLTLSASEARIAAALRAGIRGYVLKADAVDDLVRAVGDVTHGATFISPSASRVLCEPYLPKAGPARTA